MSRPSAVVFGVGSAKYRKRPIHVVTWGIPAWTTPGRLVFKVYRYALEGKDFPSKQAALAYADAHGIPRIEVNRQKVEIEEKRKIWDFTEGGTIPVRTVCYMAAFAHPPTPKPDGSPASNRQHPFGAGCIEGCFARTGNYQYANVALSQMNRYTLSLVGGSKAGTITRTQRQELDRWLPKRYHGKSFRDVLDAELSLSVPITKSQKRKGLPIKVFRVHDSGDFYSASYVADWLWAIRRHPQTIFFGYTKMVQATKQVLAGGSMPRNFRLAYSEGGMQDEQIDTATDRHSRIFSSFETMGAAGYANAHFDDASCFIDNKRKIGLLYHHSNPDPALSFSTDPATRGKPFAPQEAIGYDEFFALVKRNKIRAGDVPNRRTIPLMVVPRPT